MPQSWTNLAFVLTIISEQTLLLFSRVLSRSSFIKLLFCINICSITFSFCSISLSLCTTWTGNCALWRLNCTSWRLNCTSWRLDFTLWKMNCTSWISNDDNNPIQYEIETYNPMPCKTTTWSWGMFSVRFLCLPPFSADLELEGITWEQDKFWETARLL